MHVKNNLINQKVKKLLDTSIEELKLIVKLISFRLIVFIWFISLLPCFQSHLACYSQVQKIKTESLPRLQKASL